MASKTNHHLVASEKKNAAATVATQSLTSADLQGRGVVTPTSKDATSSLDGRMSVEKEVVDELLLVCGVIGTTTSDGNKLVPVTDCLNWLQDLQRALRRDEDLYRPISILLGKWKVVEQKLLPLVMTCRYDTSIVLTVVKILVILTKPLADNTKRAGRMVIDASGKSDPSVVREQIKLRENAVAQAQLLVEYKSVVTHHSSHHPGSKGGTGLLSIFVSLLADPLSKTGSSRTEVDHLTIELVLHLFRNLLAAEPLLYTSSDCPRESNELHNELISLFDRELVMQILFVIGQDMESRENAQYNLLMMELLHHLFKSKDPSAVVRSAKPAKESVMKSSSALTSSLKKQQEQRRALVGVRHGHFGGTWMREERGGKRRYIGATKLRQSNKFCTMAKRKNRKAEPFIGSGKSLLAHSRWEIADTCPSTTRANQCLHNFCFQFIKDCYGPVMKSLKNEFRRDSNRLEEGDKVVFIRIVWFLCQWWRLARTDSSLSQLVFTMDLFTFNLVFNAIDNFVQHKKHSQLAQAVALYSEMMQFLQDMQASKDVTENMMASGLLDRLFYGTDPLDRLPKLLSHWTPGTTSREYLCDLVELCHVSLKLLETAEKNGERTDNNMEKVKAASPKFDAKSYFCRKLVSNQLVSMYIHLLREYKINATRVNHRILSMFLRFSRTELSSPDSREEGSGRNLLASRVVTLEPMLLLNIHLLMVVEKILNDESIHNDKPSDNLIAFCTDYMLKFWTISQSNKNIYVDCLFRHVAPHRFCEAFTNLYVDEELRMIAERDMLLAEQFRQQSGYDEDGGEPRNADDDEVETEFDHGTLGGGNVDSDGGTSASKRTQVTLDPNHSDAILKRRRTNDADADEESD